MKRGSRHDQVFKKLLVQSPNLISGKKSIVGHLTTARVMLGQAKAPSRTSSCPQCHVPASSPSTGKRGVCKGCGCWLRPSPPMAWVRPLSNTLCISGHETRTSLDISGAADALFGLPYFFSLPPREKSPRDSLFSLLFFFPLRCSLFPKEGHEESRVSVKGGMVLSLKVVLRPVPNAWKKLRKGHIGSSTSVVSASNLQQSVSQGFSQTEMVSFYLKVLDGLLFSPMKFNPLLNFHNLLASTAPCSNKFHCLSMYCGKKSLILFWTCGMHPGVP